MQHSHFELNKQFVWKLKQLDGEKDLLFEDIQNYVYQNPNCLPIQLVTHFGIGYTRAQNLINIIKEEIMSKQKCEYCESIKEVKPYYIGGEKQLLCTRCVPIAQHDYMDAVDEINTMQQLRWDSMRLKNV